MRIISLKAENIKKLKAVEITPDQKEAVVKITGKNGQGKTSVLDSILYALAGGRKIPQMPIRKGRKRGKIKMDLGELIVERSFTEKGSYLKVLTKDGAEFPKAQEKLSELMQGVSFDPAEFMRMDDKERIEIIKEITGQGAIFDALEGDFQIAYDERKFANRELKEAEARFKGLEKVEKVEPIDVSQLANELSKLAEKKNELDGLHADKKFMESNLKDLEQRVENLKSEIKGVCEAIERAEKGFDLSEAQAKKEKLEQSKEINEQYRQYETYVNAEGDFKAASAKAEKAQESLDHIVKRKAELIKNSKMPIENLAIEDGQVYVDGIPFEQLSTSEQIRLSFSVAMAINPELKVIRITDGSLLDQDALKIIEGLAKDKDYQVWIELVGDDGTGFCIEDGHIKGDENDYDEPEPEAMEESKLKPATDLEPENI